MSRKNVSSGAPWESKFAYSRAVRVGNVVEVTGTAAVNDEGVTVHPGDAYKQAQFIFTKIGKALAACDAHYKDVVRTRMFVTDISLSEQIGQAHKECFDGINPATTMVEVSKLIDPEMLVEIEATAVIL